jgi:hypothetical protein
MVNPTGNKLPVVVRYQAGCGRQDIWQKICSMQLRVSGSGKLVGPSHQHAAAKSLQAALVLGFGFDRTASGMTRRDRRSWTRRGWSLTLKTKQPFFAPAEI